uniref:NAD-dependent epimerase/dehydratase domain-containing protein n=1 Tax=Solanum lycopersicum TaxID=4081 RepID=A0A3Q7EG46_SOLLC
MGAEHLEKTSVKKHTMISKKALSSSIVNYVLGEQRLICLFIGIVVSVSALSVINLSPRGKVPLGLKRKNLRVLVTGGAGFVGSHLVDRLIERGDSVIVVDNFFTGQKQNLLHHLNNPKFELVRHDVVEPILLEVDHIYHLACPASPVHYKYNPVKTIISFYYD